MPQLAALYKKYEEQGFHIVGLECQGSTANEISSLAKSKGAGYQITTGGDLKGSNVRGIPHGFLFGPDGKLAADDPRGARPGIAAAPGGCHQRIRGGGRQ